MPKEAKKEVIAAHDMAKKQREISVSEFFTKNRHLLGFDNPSRALLMVVKEGVDNSLDACSEARIIPDIHVEIKKLAEDRFNVIIEDNGPGIVKEQIPKVFGKLLYGSKFHRQRQSRGQQGLGISAACLYSQLTTGKSMLILSKIHPKKPAHYFELKIDTAKNEPLIVKDEVKDWPKDHGTRIEVELIGKYQKGRQSVDEFLKEAAIVNPEAEITYITPDNEKIIFRRVTNQLAPLAKEIMPHPYGIELGTLISKLAETSARSLQGFLTSEFSRIGPGTAKEMCEKAGLKPDQKPKSLTAEQAEKLFRSMQEVKVIAPPTDCLSPIGAELLEKGLRKEIPADFYVTTSRSPVVYRGFPFTIEVGIAYGGQQDKESQIKLMRFANRVPLLYQQGACAITEAVTDISWKPYGLNQSGNNLPTGPAVIIVHMASVWVPFTSEAKDAIAHYDEIIKEIKLALQECGRKLNAYINKHVRAQEQREKIDLFEKYIPELANALSNLTSDKKEVLQEKLKKLLKKELPTLEAENGAKEQSK